MMSDNGFDKRELYIRWILSKRFRKQAKQLFELYERERSFWHKLEYIEDRAQRYLNIAEALENMERPIEEIYV